MNIILISGKAQNGKDTTAGILKNQLEERGASVLIAHYADLVKYVCRTFFDWDGVKDEYGRRILQYVGTDVVRAKDPDFWVRFLSEIICMFSDEWDYVIIPDTRFPNEIEGMKKMASKLIHLRVRRPGYISTLTSEQQAHPSETALDNVEPDYWINNDGTMNGLEEAVSQFVREELV